MKENFWDTNAQQWANLLETHMIKSREVTNAAILNEILKSKPKSILDIGCGEGWISRKINPNINYLGIDASSALIDIAKSKSQKKFQVVSYSKIESDGFNLNQKFDVIVFNFSILDDFSSAVLRQLKSNLENKGQILIQTLHPCFQKISYADQIQVEDFKTVSSDFKGDMKWQHRTLSTWFKLFKGADFFVSEITEPILNDIPASIIFNLKPL